MNEENKNNTPNNDDFFNSTNRNTTQESCQSTESKGQTPLKLKNNKNNKQEKPFYKRWWFITIVVIIVFGLFVPNKEDNNDVLAVETDGLPPAYNNLNTKEAGLFVLYTGTFIVGENIPAGRYVMSSPYGTASLFINEENGVSLTNAIIGSDFGVNAITANISDGQKITISGLNHVVFTPVKARNHSNTLTAGTWTVGLDIKEGTYTAYPKQNEIGNFIVYSTDGRLVVNERLGSDYGVDNVKVTLEKGYIIILNGINGVTFE